jgi:uncharacterized protein (TIGR02217 family)
MGFLAERFPEHITTGAVGGPMYSTTVAYTTSGSVQRNQNWAYPRHRYEISQGIKNDADWRAADAFFRKARGRAHSFRLKDWTDYELAVADSELTQITSTTFQLAKVYGSDEPTFREVRRLTRIVAGTLQVFLNGALQASPANYTVDLDTGVVTFASAPGGATRTASCEFDVPCMFEFDEREAELVHRAPNGESLLRWESIRIVEDPLG